MAATVLTSFPVKPRANIIECSICAEVFIDPRTLSCGHSYCFACISRWMESKRVKHSVQCPSCRTECTIPEHGLGDLPKNDFLAKLLMARELSATKRSVTYCEMCIGDGRIPKGQKVVRSLCVDCRKMMCNKCSEVHAKMKSTRPHRIYNVGDLTEQKLTKFMTSRCDQHPENDVEVYCFRCEITVCTACCVAEHRGHKCFDIIDAACDFRKQIAMDISSMETLTDKFAGEFDLMDDFRSRIGQQVKRIENEICQKAEELIERIERDKRRLLDEISGILVCQVKEADKATSEIRQHKALVENAIKYSEEMLKQGSNSDVTKEALILHNRTADLLKKYEYNSAVHALANYSIKFVHPNVVCESNCNVVGAFSHGSATLTDYVSGSKDILALVTLKNRLYVTLYDKDYIEVFDTDNFQQQRTISCFGLGSELWGLAACSVNNYLYVSDYQNSSVRKINLSSILPPTKAKKWPVNWPTGLSITRSNNLLVVCGLSENVQIQQTVQEYTSDGALVREMVDSNSLWHALKLGDGTLLASRRGPFHGVCVFDTKGKAIRSFGSVVGSRNEATTRRRLLNNPGCVSISKYGFVLVADCNNHRILVVNPTMTDAHALPLPLGCNLGDDVLRNPCALWFDESNDRLYVGECGGQKRLLVLDNIFNVFF